MTTELTHRHAGKTNENAQAGKIPAKGNTLFRKIAPLVATTFLAAGCGSKQPAIDSNFVIEGAPPQQGWVPEKKSEPGAENAPVFPAEHAELLRPFAEQFGKNGGMAWIRELLKGSEKNRIFLEDGGIQNISTKESRTVLRAEYGRGRISLTFFDGSPYASEKSGPGITRSDEVKSGMGMLEDASGNMIFPPQVVPKSESNTELKFQRSGKKESPFGCEVRASSPGEEHIFDYNINNTPNMGKVIAIYDNGIVYALVINQMSQFVEIGNYSLEDTFGSARPVSAGSWKTDDGKIGYLFFVQQDPSDTDKIIILPFWYGGERYHFPTKSLYLQYTPQFQ